MRHETSEQSELFPAAIHRLTVVGLLLTSAALISGAPVVGYLLLGPLGAIAGVILSLLLMSKRAWAILLAPFGASSIAGDVIGECQLWCRLGEPGSPATADRRADADAFLRYGIDRFSPR